jgi:hypothetical protein
MNIAIPVSAHDKHLLPQFVKVLQHFGGLEDTPVCFFATPSAKLEAHEAASALNATVHTFEVDFAHGWPVASGMQFAATVFTLPRIGWQGPWLWMELDMLPVKKGWLQSLRNGYAICGKPFMGNVVPTAWAENGKLVVREDDLMMMGCGVYPANMHADERFRPLLADLVKAPPRNPNTPFDFYLRHPMRYAGIANTGLIADMWQTCEYKRTSKGITCQPVKLDKPRRERGGLVPPEAVIVHGCKDGTLAELLLGAAEYHVPKERVAVKEIPVAGVEEVLQTEIIVTDALPPDTAVVVSPSPAVRESGFVKSVLPLVTEKADATTPDTTIVMTEVEQPATDAPKPKITRTAVEAMRKSKKDNALQTAQGLGITLGEFAGMLPTLGYVIAKGGKLKSTI